jgi:ATP-dependent Lon protease
MKMKQLNESIVHALSTWQLYHANCTLEDNQHNHDDIHLIIPSGPPSIPTFDDSNKLLED